MFVTEGREARSNGEGPDHMHNLLEAIVSPTSSEPERNNRLATFAKLRSICKAQKLHSLVLQEVAPVRRLPTIDDAPGPTACAAADVQVVCSRGTQAAMS